MIDELRGLAVFVAVARSGSFTAAGRALKLSTSVVSHHILRLEDRLGVALFFRSTRSVTLTAEGQKILAAAGRMVAAGEEALDLVTEDSDQPVGVLRISIPAFVSGQIFEKRLWDFARSHPMVALSIRASDQRVDLVRDGFDLAIRLGQMADSSLKSRRIGSFQRALVASPDFIDGCELDALDNLADSPFISYAMLPEVVTLARSGEEVTVPMSNSQVEIDSISTALSAARAGLGIAVLPRSLVEADLQSGTLVEVLPQWQLPTLGVYAVWPDTGTQKKLTRRLIDHLAATD